jgi:hypothetical protein
MGAFAPQKKDTSEKTLMCDFSRTFLHRKYSPIRLKNQNTSKPITQIYFTGACYTIYTT